MKESLDIRENVMDEEGVDKQAVSQKEGVISVKPKIPRAKRAPKTKYFIDKTLEASRATLEGEYREARDRHMEKTNDNVSDSWHTFIIYCIRLTLCADHYTFVS